MPIPRTVSISPPLPSPPLPPCRLLHECITALAAPSCSEASRGVMLGALESLFDLPDTLGLPILAPHLQALLDGLQAIVAAGGADMALCGDGEGS